jgi:hypothetical protein
VRDANGRVVATQQRCERLVDERLRFGVERGCRLVEDEDIRRLEQRTRDGDALLLPARELGAARADLRVEAVGLGGQRGIMWGGYLRSR